MLRVLAEPRAFSNALKSGSVYNCARRGARVEPLSPRVEPRRDSTEQEGRGTRKVFAGAAATKTTAPSLTSSKALNDHLLDSDGNKRCLQQKTRAPFQRTHGSSSRYDSR